MARRCAHRGAELGRGGGIGRDRDETEPLDPVGQHRAPGLGPGPTREAERHRHGPEMPEPVERVAERGPVLGEDPDPRSRRDARGRELARDPARACRQLAERPALSRREVVVEHDAVEPARPLIDELDDARRLTVLGTLRARTP